MIKKYKEFINEGIFDLLSGYSMEEVKEKLKHLTPVDKFNKLKQLELTYQNVYTQEEIDNFADLEKKLASNNYDMVCFFDGKILIRLNYKYGFVDTNGNELSPIKYDWIFTYKNNFAKVKIDDKLGIIDKNGKEITPIKYEWISDFNKGRANFKLNNKFGYVDTNGKEYF